MLPQYVVVALKVEKTISGWLSSGKLVSPKGDNIQRGVFGVFLVKNPLLLTFILNRQYCLILKKHCFTLLILQRAQFFQTLLSAALQNIGNYFLVSLFW